MGFDFSMGAVEAIMLAGVLMLIWPLLTGLGERARGWTRRPRAA